MKAIIDEQLDEVLEKLGIWEDFCKGNLITFIWTVGLIHPIQSEDKVLSCHPERPKGVEGSPANGINWLLLEILGALSESLIRVTVPM